MTEITEFESLRMKARKLAALAARGVDGERETAQRKLEAFLRQHGMTLDSLEAGDKRVRSFACVLNPLKPKPDRDVARLAWQCLVYVLGYSPEAQSCLMRETAKSAKGKGWSCWVHYVELSDADLEDWQACFAHYAPAFEATRVRLRRTLRAALKGFIHAHDLFAPPDNSKKSKPLSPAELQALIDAMNNSQGDKWQRPAGRLQQSDFLLK